MGGLIILAMIISWLIFLKFVVNWIFRRLPEFRFKAYFSIVIYILLIPLPVIDEIVGGFQFRAICKEGAVLKIDAEKIKGKTVRVIDTTNGFIYLSGTVIPIDTLNLSFRDVITDEEYASYSVYRAKIGWLRRTIGYPTSAAGSCTPPDRNKINEQYQFVIVK